MSEQAFETLADSLLESLEEEIEDAELQGGVLTVDADEGTSTLATRLRAPDRKARATALAAAIHEIVLAIDEAKLR